MSSAPVPPASDVDGPLFTIRARRRVLMVAGAILAASIAVFAALLAISQVSDGQVSVLIGILGSEELGGLALVTALASIAVGLCVVPVTRRWLWVMVPARLAALATLCLAAFAWLLTAGATVVPLISAGCDTGYVVREESFLLAGWGTVYRTDGILVTAVARTSGDDGYHPFNDGAYAVVDDGDSLRVWYSIVEDYAAAPVSTGDQPAFVLPALTGRTAVCGLSTHARAPLPSPPQPPDYTIKDADASIRQMMDASLAAAGSSRDRDGASIDPDTIAPITTTCDAGGDRAAVMLEFKTDDNADSLARILEVWDAAGYAPDHAMQEDIRYSETLPIEKMSIRDLTSIDGLIHLQVTSRCLPAGPQVAPE